VPARVKALVEAGLAHDLPAALALHPELFHRGKGLLTLSTNPIPVKAAMKRAGVDTGSVRLPLTELPDDLATQLEQLLKQTGVLEGAGV